MYNVLMLFEKKLYNMLNLNLNLQLIYLPNG